MNALETMSTQPKAGELGAGGYLWIEIDGVKHRADKLAVLMMTGEYPDEVVHLDGDKTNNIGANLQAA
jgi:hypothetical protein